MPPTTPRRSEQAAPAAARRTDDQLIKACLAADGDAWNELVERYQRLVYSVPRRCGLNGADADDVLQNVFCLLFRKLDSLRDGTRLASWLLTTSHRESWRLSRRRLSLADVDETMGDDGMPSEDELVRREHQDIVRRALRALGGRDAALLIALFRSPGQPCYAQIARELDMPVGSIGPTRTRCFGKLRKILTEMGFDPATLIGDEVDSPAAETAVA